MAERHEKAPPHRFRCRPVHVVKFHSIAHVSNAILIPLHPSKCLRLLQGLLAREDIRSHKTDDRTVRSSRLLISSRSRSKSIGLVSKPPAPPSIARRFVSGSPYAVIIIT